MERTAPRLFIAQLKGFYDWAIPDQPAPLTLG